MSTAAMVESPDLLLASTRLKQIIDAAPERYRVLFVVLAGTGMRIGEALALNPREDLDLDNGVIYVRRSIWRGHELTPKTEKGVCAATIRSAGKSS